MPGQATRCLRWTCKSPTGSYPISHRRAITDGRINPTSSAQSIVFDRRPQGTANRSALPIIQYQRHKVYRPYQCHLGGSLSDFETWDCRFYCGFEDAIEVFDVHREGNNEGTRLHTTPSKKAKDGLKGQVTLPSIHNFLSHFTIKPFGYRNRIFHSLLPRPNRRILRCWDVDPF